MSKDFFAHKASDYEANDRRVRNVQNIADAISRSVTLGSEMNLMDFGAGTGLLLQRIAPSVNKITAVDVSKSMIEQLEKKRDDLDCELEIREVDLVTEDINEQFDGIISSMTLHHVKDTEKLFSKLYQLTRPGGFVALADLDKEDGSFHQEDSGVFHQGFDRELIASILSEAGFKEVNICDASVVNKPYGDYPVFLLTGIKSL